MIKIVQSIYFHKYITNIILVNVEILIDLFNHTRTEDLCGSNLTQR